jgi:hypothetical protein
MGIGTSQWLSAARAGLGRRGCLVVGRCLPGQGIVEHTFRQDLTDIQEEVFDLRQFGPPGWTRRAVELLDQVFRDPVEIGTDFFYLRGTLLGSRHPWLLLELGSKEQTDFLQPV